MEKIPTYMIYFRMLLGILVPVLAYLYGESAILPMMIFIVVGFFADIFDGIIARKLNVSTSALRILDSVVDRVFWICVLIACYILYPAFTGSKLPILILIMSLDAITYCISLIRFKKLPSPHNLLTKLWGILIAISFVEIIIFGSSGVLFQLVIVVGFVSRMDSMLIYCLLKKWDHDIPSSHHAFKLRAGKGIVRHKLFNG